MMEKTKRWFRVASACALLLACARAEPRETLREPSASSGAVRAKAPVVAATAKSVPAKLAATAEVAQLIALSKTKLSQEEKRARLQATLENFRSTATNARS